MTKRKLSTFEHKGKALLTTFVIRPLWFLPRLGFSVYSMSLW